jgi:hypothetical protein
MKHKKESGWLTVKEAAALLNCSTQNVYYLISGIYRPSAKRKKITPPVFRSVKTIKKGKSYFTHLIDRNEVKVYLQNKKGERHESI